MPSPHGGVPCPKPRPHILDVREERREAERAQLAVYRTVDQRDTRQCRICSRRGNPYGVTALEKLHHTHLKDASLVGDISTTNLYLSCAFCHALIHAKQIRPIGTDANATGSDRLTWDIDEAAVVEIFGTRTVPRQVRIVIDSRRKGFTR